MKRLSQGNSHRRGFSILLTLFALVYLSMVSFGLYTLYSQWMRIESQDARQHRKEAAQKMGSEIEFLLFGEIPRVMERMSQNPVFLDALKDPSNSDFESKARLALGFINESFDLDIVYLMGSSGTVLFSTQLETGGTLEAADLSFRPYFQRAIQGSPITYPAVGTMTQKRGLFYAYPIRFPGKDQVDGVLVAKMKLDLIDEILLRRKNPCSLVSGEGVVFASNVKDWLYKTATYMSVEEIKEIQDSMQYSDIPLEFLGLSLDESEVNYKGKDYQALSIPLSLQGWRLVQLLSSENVDASLPRNRALLLALLAFSSLALLISILVLVRAVEKQGQLSQDLRLLKDEFARLNYQLQGHLLPVTGPVDKKSSNH